MGHVYLLYYIADVCILFWILSGPMEFFLRTKHPQTIWNYIIYVYTVYTFVSRTIKESLYIMAIVRPF